MLLLKGSELQNRCFEKSIQKSLHVFCSSVENKSCHAATAMGLHNRSLYQLQDYVCIGDCDPWSPSLIHKN